MDLGVVTAILPVEGETWMVSSCFSGKVFTKSSR